MITKGLLELFRDVIDGGRGAAERNDVLRCRHEIELAKAMLTALEDVSPATRFSQGIDEYQNHAETENDEIMKWRSSYYRKLLLAAGEISPSDIERSKVPYYDALTAILETGLSFAQQANEEEDSQRVEIETDHIHNVPTYMTTDGRKAIRYYLETERTFYLDRIEEHFGVQSREIAAGLFAPHWRSIMS